MTTFDVKLIIRIHPDRLTATSPAVPGLHISGATLPAVIQSAKKGIRCLLERNCGMRVLDVGATDDATVLRVRVEQPPGVGAPSN